MICNKCGQECTDDVKFCTNCGAELTEAEVKEEVAVEEAVAEETVTAEEAVAEETVEAEVQEEEAEPATEPVKKVAEPKEKKESSFDFGALLKNKIVWAAAAVVVIILLLVLLVKGCSGSESYVALSDKAVVEVRTEEDQVCVYLINGDKIETGDEEASYIRYSQDMSTICYENEDEELIVVKNGKVTKNGIEEAADYMISTYGDTLLYYTDYEWVSYYDAYYDYYDEQCVGTLHLYDIKKDKDYEIADEVVEESAVLSPNGETVAFVADFEATDDFKGYYSIKGKDPVEVGKEKCVFAIADKAAYIYYTDDDRIYAQKKGKDEVKLAGDVYGVEAMMNADHTEMLFFNDGKTYVTVKAGEKKKVSNDELYDILLNTKAIQGDNWFEISRNEIEVCYSGVDTFKNKLFYCYDYDSYDGKIVYVNNKYESDTVASDVDDYAVAEDGESLVYVDSKGDILKVTSFAKGGKETVLAEDAEASYIYAGGDLKYVYFVNYDDELCYVKGKKTKKIADDVTEIAVSADGKYCYYEVDDEELCYSKNAGKGKKLVSVDDGGMDISAEYGLVLLEIWNEDDEESVYYTMDGKKMKEIYRYEWDY